MHYGGWGLGTRPQNAETWASKQEAWMVKAGLWSLLWYFQATNSLALLWVFPGSIFWLFTVERGKTWKISSCVMMWDSLLGTAHHVMKSPRPPPSPYLHTVSDQKLDGSLGKSLLYQCVYLFKVEIASIRSTRLFSTSHIQKTECRKVGLGLKVKGHRSIGIL